MAETSQTAICITNMKLKLVKVAEELLELRNKIKTVEEPLKALKERRDMKQDELLKEMNRVQLFSARTEMGTVSKAVRKTLKVIDEKALVADLKKQGLTDYISEGVNELFDEMKKQAVKEGKTFNGTELSETEYISITGSDKEDKRKQSTE